MKIARPLPLAAHRTRPRGSGCVLSTIVLLAISACGGGGGDTVNRPATSTTVAADLPAPQAQVTTLAGTVAMGAPVVGAQVSAKCLTASVQALAPTDARGGYTVALHGVAPPCLLQASGGTVGGSPLNEPLHGLALATGTAQVNPLTELALAKVFAQSPALAYGDFGRSTAPNEGTLTNAQTYVRQQLSAIGLSAPAQDLFNGAFNLGDRTDLVLDGLNTALQAHTATLAQLRQAAALGESLATTLAQAEATEAARLVAEAQARAAAEAVAAAADTVSGTVALLDRISGASISLRCSGGTPQSGVSTGSDGRFAVRLYQASLPCLIEARGGITQGEASNAVLHGWVTAGGAEVQLTPLSELALSHAYAASPASIFPAFASAADAPSASALLAAQTWLDSQLQALGLSPSKGHVFTGRIDIADATERLLAALSQRLYDKDSSLAAILPAAQARNNLRPIVDADKQVAVQFAAVAGNTPIKCGDLIPALGSTGTAGKLADFRFYIQDAALLRSDGAVVPLRLPANNDWQYTANNGDTVTLIDLEDGSAECATEGNSATNALLAGSVPAGRYTGLLITIGVPESLSHTSTSTAPAPIDSLAMGWSWQAGRKFLKVEVTQPTLNAWPSDTFYIHQGSTGCTGNAGQGTVVCSKPNRALVRLPAFNGSTQKVAVDMSALLAGTNITINQGGAGGCMSAATDPDCLKVFEALGIAWRADGTGSGLPVDSGLLQTVFKAVSK